MNLQYISDNTGKTTGVYIPISDWNELKSKFDGIEQLDVPSWQSDEVRERLNAFGNNPEEAMDFNSAIDEIEKNF